MTLIDMEELATFTDKYQLVLNPTMEVANTEWDGLRPECRKWETKIIKGAGTKKEKHVYLYTYTGMGSTLDTQEALSMILDDTDGLPTYDWNYKRYMEESGNEYVAMGMSRLTVYEWYCEQYRNLKALKDIMGETAMIELLELKAREEGN